MRCMIFATIFISCLLFASAATARVPDVREVQQAALNAHKLNDDQLDRWSSRARLANLVPQITFGADFGFDDVESEDYRELLANTDDELLFKTLQSDSKTQVAQDWGFKVGLTWKPAGLIFDSAELSAARVERINAVHRTKLLEEVTHLFFEWRDAERQSQRAPHEDRERQITRSELAAARLDALTNGWFRHTLREGGEK